MLTTVAKKNLTSFTFLMSSTTTARLLYCKLARRRFIEIPFNRSKSDGVATTTAMNTKFKSIARVCKVMADLDNLEYSIKFPNSGAYRTEKKLIPVINEEKPPVIVLFGWAGCLDKHLEKYSNIYEERGMITLRHATSAKLIFWKRGQLKSIGHRFIKLLQEVNLDGHPVVVHCFSNGGSFLYKNFACALAEAPNQVQVKGVILDSAPGERHIMGLYRATSAIIGGNVWYNVPASIFVTTVLVLIWQYDLIKSILFGDNYELDPIQWLKRQENICPQLFVYSKADDLIPYTDIEAFINIRRDMDVDVSVVRFDDSPHVKHYTLHPKRYVEGVCDFLVKCLKSKTKL